LDAKNWHSVSRNEIRRAGGTQLLKLYKGSLIKTLLRVYPELNLKQGEC